MIHIIGAGPAVCIAARACSKIDEVTLFEEHPFSDEYQQRVACAGLVSLSGLERLGIDEKALKKNNIILNEIRGARFYCRDIQKPSLVIDGGRTKALVVDRGKFDRYLLKKAIDDGVEFVNEYVRFECGNKNKKLNFNSNLNYSFNSKKINKIIIATGTDYNIHRVLQRSGIQGVTIPKLLVSAQYDLVFDDSKISGFKNDFVNMFFDIPGFFTWMIPLEKNTLRIGTASFKNPVPHLEKFIGKFAECKGGMANYTISNKIYGTIPVYNKFIKTQYEYKDTDILLVGDAAAQVKATTGGGIVMGGICALQTPFHDYEKRWKSVVGGELDRHLFIRKFLNKLKFEETEDLLKFTSNYKYIIEKHGDMDMASALITAAIKKPRFAVKFLLKFGRKLV